MASQRILENTFTVREFATGGYRVRKLYCADRDVAAEELAQARKPVSRSWQKQLGYKWGEFAMHMLDQLLSRHEDIRAILDMLEQEVETLGQAETADLGAMKDGFYYITQYLGPDHNNKERVIYRNVAARKHGASRLINELIQQHEELRRRSEELLESVEDMTEDILVARAEFDARAHHYIKLQRQHVSREENELLPLADQLLTDDDWKQLEQTLRQQ